MKICILDNCPRAANGYTKAGRLRRKKGDAKILAEACPTSETEPDGRLREA